MIAIWYFSVPRNFSHEMPDFEFQGNCQDKLFDQGDCQVIWQDNMGGGVIRTWRDKDWYWSPLIKSYRI